MTLYECSTYTGFNPNAWDVWGKTNGNVCNSDISTPHDWQSCFSPVATWNIGGTSQFLPDHVGIPIGGKTAFKYYMLEVHYDNPNAKKLVDHSGFRIHYTSELRPHDAGMIISGITVSETQILPPKQKLFRNIGICGPSCLDPVVPDDGINIVAVTLHSHNSAKQMRLRHVRGGKELDRIVEDNHFDIQFQETYQLANETTVLKGDYVSRNNACKVATLKFIQIVF